MCRLQIDVTKEASLSASDVRRYLILTYQQCSGLTLDMLRTMRECPPCLVTELKGKVGAITQGGGEKSVETHQQKQTVAVPWLSLPSVFPAGGPQAVQQGKGLCRRRCHVDRWGGSGLICSRL